MAIPTFPKRITAVGSVIFVCVILVGVFEYSAWGKAFRARLTLAAAQNLAEQGNCKEALVKFTRASLLDKHTARGAAEKVNMCFIAQGGVSEESATTFGDARIDPIYLAGWLAYREGDCVSLQAVADRVRASQPRDAASFSLIASAFSCNREWATAREWYEKALEADPNNIHLLNGLAYAITSFWADYRTRPEDASNFWAEINYSRALLERAVALDPSDWRGYYNLALSYYEFRDPDDYPAFPRAYQNVVSFLEQFFRRYGDSPSWTMTSYAAQQKRLFVAHYLLGRSHEGLGNAAAAKIHFQEALTIVSKNPAFVEAYFVTMRSREGAMKRIEYAREYLSRNQ